VKRLTENKNEDSSLPPGIALVVDAKERLLGIVTNGDLRRAFAAGVELDAEISKIMNKTPSVITAENTNNILPHLFEKIKAGEWPKNRLEKILIVDRNKKVLDLVSFYDLVHTSDVRFKHIGVVGLGYVGLTLALTTTAINKYRTLFGKGKRIFTKMGCRN
jgi:signal-transduction protein with cAMP-binding, CBS, and nucleotidyltransferase domain